MEFEILEFPMNSSAFSSRIPPDFCNTHPFFLVGDWIWRIGALVCVLVGIPGHFLVITVMLNSKNRRQPISLYFATIAVCELFYLFIVFWSWCSSFSLLRDPRDLLTCGTYYSLTIGLSHCSTLLLTAASVDRVLIVLYPSRYSTFVTRTKALIKIIFILVFVLIVIIQYHFSFYFSHSFRVCQSYFDGQFWYGKVTPLIRFIILAFLPCSITCVCSIIIFQNRFYRRPSTSSETTGSRHMRTASLILVIYSIYYSLTILPIDILQFFQSIFITDLPVNCLKFSLWKNLMKFSMLLMAINYSNKFFVHYLISVQFRREVFNLLTRRRFSTKSTRTRTFDLSSHR